MAAKKAGAPKGPRAKKAKYQSVDPTLAAALMALQQLPSILQGINHQLGALVDAVGDVASVLDTEAEAMEKVAEAKAATAGLREEAQGLEPDAD